MTEALQKTLNAMAGTIDRLHGTILMLFIILVALAATATMYTDREIDNAETAILAACERPQGSVQ